MLELISLIDEIRAQYSSYLSYGVNGKEYHRMFILYVTDLFFLQ